MLAWRIVFLICLVTFIVIFLLLRVTRPLKNHFVYQITNDELFKSYKDDYGYNYIFSTSGETKNFIRRYVIRESGSTKTLICSYNRFYEEISYHIICLNRRNKPIKAYRVKENNTKTHTSLIFLLPNKTKRVNVVIKRVEGVSYNSKVIAPIPKIKCRFYTLFSSIRLMCLLYMLRHLLIEILGSGYTIYFMDSIYNVISLLLILFVTLAYALLMYRGLRRKNFKRKIGGSLEYEFF